MNSDEIEAIVRQLVMFAGATALSSGVVTNQQLVTIAGAVATLAATGWTIYSNWDQRKVHETSVVTSTAATVAAAREASIPGAK